MLNNDQKHFIRQFQSQIPDSILIELQNGKTISDIVRQKEKALEESQKEVERLSTDVHHLTVSFLRFS